MKIAVLLICILHGFFQSCSADTKRMITDEEGLVKELICDQCIYFREEQKPKQDGLIHILPKQYETWILEFEIMPLRMHPKKYSHILDFLYREGDETKELLRVVMSPDSFTLTIKFPINGNFQWFTKDIPQNVYSQIKIKQTKLSEGLASCIVQINGDVLSKSTVKPEIFDNVSMYIGTPVLGKTTDECTIRNLYYKTK